MITWAAPPYLAEARDLVEPELKGIVERLDAASEQIVGWIDTDGAGRPGPAIDELAELATFVVRRQR